MRPRRCFHLGILALIASFAAIGSAQTTTVSFTVTSSGTISNSQIQYSYSVKNGMTRPLIGFTVITNAPVVSMGSPAGWTGAAFPSLSGTAIQWVSLGNASVPVSQTQNGFSIVFNTTDQVLPVYSIVDTSMSQLASDDSESISPGTLAAPGSFALLSPVNGDATVSTSGTLTWSQSPNATSYDVYFGPSSTPPLVSNTGATSYTPAALSPAVTYFWKVVAKNSAGNTDSGAVWSFTPASPTPPPSSGGSSGLLFRPTAPCRIVDTRNPAGPFGGPFIAALASRDFAVPASACGIPASAKAYSLNVTAVPRGPLPYLTVWPTGGAQPFVSTLNALDGRIKANAALVPAGTNGGVSVYAAGATDVVIDINGYFVPSTDTAGLAFYSVSPCRISDTRNAAGALGGPSFGALQSRTLPVLSSSCGIPATASAYSLNFTAVPKGALPYLTVWPTGSSMPVVSTLNALTGTIVANAAIVPAGNGGSIDVYAAGATDVVVDVNGYFAPRGAAGALSFYSVAPCRVADTRNAAGPLGGPSMRANGARQFTVPGSACNVPAANAYSLNATVVPSGSLAYLTLYPSGGIQPYVSTLNALDGAITSNAAIVPASAAGGVSAFATNGTDLVLDIDGYFAP